MKNTKDLPLVLVSWIDSVLESSHEVALEDDISGFGKLLEREDIGYLVRIDRKEVVLAISRCHGDNTVSYSNTIPRGWVKKITFLVEKLEETDGEPGNPSKAA